MSTAPLPYAGPTTPPAANYNGALHATAWGAMVCIFPLIWMGGLVTSHGAGMAVPDWPNSFGYSMFALPFSQWLGTQAGGVFYEHFHRLLGTVAGLACVALVAQAWGPARNRAWRRIFGWNAMIWLGLALVALSLTWIAEAFGGLATEKAKLSGHFVTGFASLGILALIFWTARRPESRRWLRWTCAGLLLTIIAQGLMGGFRVTEVSLLLAKLHGIFGQMVFATAAAVTVFSSRWWRSRPTNDAPVASRKMAWLAGVAIGLIVVQLVLGALMRHDPRRNPQTGAGAGLAIPDWPLHYGKVLPPMSSRQLPAINRERTTAYQLPALDSIAPVHLHFTHRLGAYLTAGQILFAAVFAFRNLKSKPGLLAPAVALGALVVVQVTLGVTTVLMRKPADIATAHQATGSLLLAVATVLFVRSLREYASRDRRAALAGPAIEPTARPEPATLATGH